ncbi:MAG: hypothetical protein KC729_17845, partial [Candidatus Eisenbacteria bacterium]|nr:hypothetical protein [Candidatus Eisenbacteria bacterium]
MKLRRLATLLMGALITTAVSSAKADVPIQDIQLGLVDVGSNVIVEDVVVTAVGAFGFFVQEPNADMTFGRKWSGIWVFTNANNGGLQEGDLVRVTGTYIEYFGFSEIDASAGTRTKTGDGVVPPAAFVPLNTVNDTGVDAEAYESVLIKVDSTDPTLYARPLDTFGEWYLATEPTAGVGDSLLVDQYSGFDYNVPPAGSVLTFAAGILVYNFNQYKLAPRDCFRDLGTDCPPILRGAYSTGSTTMNIEYGVPLNAGVMADPGNYELASGVSVNAAVLSSPNVVTLTTGTQDPGAAETVTAFASRSSAGVDGDPDQFANFRSGITTLRRINEVPAPGTSDVSPLLNEVVTVQGTVTGLDGSYYYLQDDDGGAWDAIYCRVAKDGDLHIGDLVRVAGRVNEFFESTQINFQAGVNYFANLGVAPNPPVVNDRTAAQIKYANANKLAEPWENNLVRLTPATVIDSCVVTAGEDCVGRGSPTFQEYELTQAADTAAVDLGTYGQVYYMPCTGDQLAVTGLLRYDFSAYRVTARNGDDLEVISG